MIQLSGQVVPIRLDAEKGEGKTVARKYGVTGFPTILFLDEAGKVEDTIGGYLPPAGFSQKIEEALTVHDLPNLQARYRTSPNDVVLVAKLVACYTAKGDIAHANAMLAQQEKIDPRNAKGLLSKSYSAVGDYYQLKNNFELAIPQFRKAVSKGNNAYDLAYAHVSIAACYMSQNKPKEALPEYKATAAVPNCPPELKSQAQQAGAQLSRGGGKQ